MSFEFEKLKELLDCGKNASVVYSRSGNLYFAPFFKSSTKILSISSEHLSLIKSVQNNDLKIYKVETLLEEGEQVNPISIKVLSDYSIKTGNKISFKAFDKGGNTLFEMPDVCEVFDFYRAPSNEFYVGNFLRKRSPSENYEELGKISKREIKKVLEEYAKKGMERSFVNYESASSYGASILTKKGNVYFGGQYSALDERLGVHAETALGASVISEGVEDIEYVGLISSKFREKPVPPCGCCREFWNEFLQKYKIDPVFYSFSFDSKKYKKNKLSKLLPMQWKNK